MHVSHAYRYADSRNTTELYFVVALLRADGERAPASVIHVSRY